jgi:uncharacterized protein (DUF1015 family)
MASVLPFKALRPQPQFAKQVASRPYDVLSSAEAKVEARGNPNTFLHITKSEIDLADHVDVHGKDVYERAKENLRAFIQRGVLFQESKPCYYIYQLIMEGRSQTGIVSGSSVDDYENDIIKKHEFTRPEKELDRINHIKTTGAQTGNVFLAYRNVDSIDALVTQWKASHNPVYNFTADDGVSHTIWVISADESVSRLKQLFEKEVPVTYIADGHHRAASAAKVRAELGKRKTPESDIFLTTLFPANELKILDYNRVITDLNGHSLQDFLVKIGEDFEVRESGEAVKPSELHEFGLYAAGKWYQLKSRPGTWTDDPIGLLDVTILSKNILEKHLGIHDQRTDKRIDFVGGIRGLGELEQRVNNKDAELAISLHPVSIQQLFDIADSGNVMPPKSTWFEPKLRDGLLTHLILE